MGRERIGACLAWHATERDCGVRTIERNEPSSVAMFETWSIGSVQVICNR